jgi:hypothetical protein
MTYFLFHTFCLGAFWTFYQVFLKRDTFFERNRWYLLISLAVALFAPFFDIPLSRQSAMEIGELQTFVLPEITIENVKTESWSWREVGQGIYFLGISINLIIFVLRFRKLLLLIYPTLKQRDKKVQLGQFTNVKIISSSQTFSFFNYLFWDSSQQLTSAEGKQILEHELAHINGGHSYDLIFIELQKILFWFNPLIYLYEKELRNQHEFIADRKAKTISNTEDYISLMVSSLFKSLQFNFTHSFHNQQIKQRIKMLHTKKTSWIKGNAKTVLSVAWVVIIAFTFACTKGLEKLSQEDNFLKAEKALMKAYLEEYDRFEKKYVQMQVNYMRDSEGNTYDIDIKGVPPKESEQVKSKFLALQKYWEKKNELQSMDIQAKDKHYKYLRSKILSIPCIVEKQTSSSSQEGIQVQITVDNQGNIYDLKLNKGTGNAECDNEIMTTIKEVKWYKSQLDNDYWRQYRFSLNFYFKNNESSDN